MKKVITYGTFDTLHHGHIRLLERAKALGDYLIVGITSVNYDKYRGKLNIVDSLMKRIENVKNTGLADEIIIEEYEGQKIDDIQKNNIDIFVIGSDWIGRFDYLKEYCEVAYLERTRGISSTELRADRHRFINFGIVGTGRIAKRFIPESKYVSGMDVVGVMDITTEMAQKYAESFELQFHTTEYHELLEKVDAVYIASPHQTHYSYAREAILAGKHVLCEKPLALTAREVKDLFELAEKNGVILMEGLKTLHSPGFQRLVSLAKSGEIGEIKCVDATFTKLVAQNCREIEDKDSGGSVTELGTYPALGIYMLLGLNYQDIQFSSYRKAGGVDLFTKIDIYYENAVASAKVGLGVKSEGSMVISGTRGYIYVPAPWWKTEYFEMRFEDPNKSRKFYYEFVGDGLRYELVEFLNQVSEGRMVEMHRMCSEEIVTLIEQYRNGEKTKWI